MCSESSPTDIICLRSIMIRSNPDISGFFFLFFFALSDTEAYISLTFVTCSYPLTFCTTLLRSAVIGFLWRSKCVFPKGNLQSAFWWKNYAT